MFSHTTQQLHLTCFRFNGMPNIHPKLDFVCRLDQQSLPFVYLAQVWCRQPDFDLTIFSLQFTVDKRTNTDFTEDLKGLLLNCVTDPMPRKCVVVVVTRRADAIRLGTNKMASRIEKQTTQTGHTHHCYA